jgi:AraC-like DNA-binding protein
LEIKIELIESLGKIAVFLMVLLSVFLFTVKTKRSRLPNIIFGVYLLFIAFDLIGFFTKQTENYPMVQSLKMASTLAQLPLFYLYVLSACYSNFKIKAKHLLHFIPFIAFIIIFKATSFSEHSLLIGEITGEIQYVLYIIAIFLVLRQYKTVYLENYANANNALYKWLLQITILFCIGHVFVMARWIFAKSNLEDYILNFNVVISLSVLSITIFFVLKALYQPELFKGVNINLKPINSGIENKSIKREISQDDHKTLEKIRTLMLREKPYLNPELTLQKLATQAGVPEKELSLLINHHLNKHFFDFINEYRIDDAKKILQDPAQKKLTVLEILYSVGFNSKSSFYTAFKKETKQTPTAFRNQWVRKS